MPRTFCLTGWNNGTGHFGLKIARSVRDTELGSLKVAIGERPYGTVVLPGIAPVRVHLSPSFWTTCSELRSAEIGAWMKRRGDAPWPRGRPPKYLGEFRACDKAPRGVPLLYVSVPPRPSLACCAPLLFPCRAPQSERATDALQTPVLYDGAARNHRTYTALRAARCRFHSAWPNRGESPSVRRQPCGPSTFASRNTRVAGPGKRTMEHANW